VQSPNIVQRPAVNQLSDIWFIDGSLRDVYIFNTVSADWDAFLRLAQSYPHEYTSDWEAKSLPTAASIFQDREHSHLLCILAGSVRIRCHFFVMEEIELDIDPKEIKGEGEHVAVLQLVEQLSQAIQKDAVITLETSPDNVLLKYEHARFSWQLG
jgi:hypothetical protein